MQQSITPVEAARRSAAQAVRAVAGVAGLADSDLRVARGSDGMVTIDCTLIAAPDVQLHRLGAAVQAAAAASARSVGLVAREVNVYIADIDDRAASQRPSGRSARVDFDHG